MANSNQIPLSSTELGIMWSTYMEKTMMMRVLEYMLAKMEDARAAKILRSYYDNKFQDVKKIIELFQKENIAIPDGFNPETDVHIEAPRLYDHLFALSYVRMMTKIQMGFYALHSSMCYREDILDLNISYTGKAQETYRAATMYLLETGNITCSPSVTMPKEVEYVQDKNYLSGFNLFSGQRALNTIEIGHLYQTIETNITGAEMMIGFAQAAKDKDVRNYFAKGVELAKNIIKELSEILMKSNIMPPSSPIGRATTSTTAPFSDKLMMYNANLLSSFGIGNSALGAAFSLRGDLPLKLAKLSKDIFSYAMEGGKLMVKNKWLEEPPQAEDRHQLISSSSP